MTRNADFKRRVRERMARTGESYAAARAQLLPRETTLHVTNGDSTVDEQLGLDALPWRDALHEGPVVKAAARCAPSSWASTRPSSSGATRRLDEHEGDYVLWFEADLYDQLQIVEILARLRDKPARITLRQIGEHVGIPHFGGLGELAAGAAAGAPRGRADRRRDRARRRAWDALTAPEPHGLLEVGNTPELRFMGEAFKPPRAGVPVAPRRALAVRAAPAGGHAGHEVRAVRARLAQGDPPVHGRHVRVRGARPARAAAATTRAASCASTTRGERVLARRGAVRHRALDRRRPHHGRDALALGRRPRGDLPDRTARGMSGSGPTVAVRCTGSCSSRSRCCSSRRRRRAPPSARARWSRSARSRTRSATAATLPTWASCGSTSTMTAWCRSRSRWTGTGCSPETRSR